MIACFHHSYFIPLQSVPPVEQSWGRFPLQMGWANKKYSLVEETHTQLKQFSCLHSEEE